MGDKYDNITWEEANKPAVSPKAGWGSEWGIDPNMGIGDTSNMTSEEALGGVRQINDQAGTDLQKTLPLSVYGQELVASGQASNIQELKSLLEQRQAQLSEMANGKEIAALEAKNGTLSREATVGAVLTQILPILAGAAIGGKRGALAGLGAGSLGGKVIMDAETQRGADQANLLSKQAMQLRKEAEAAGKQGMQAQMEGFKQEFTQEQNQNKGAATIEAARIKAAASKDKGDDESTPTITQNFKDLTKKHNDYVKVRDTSREILRDYATLVKKGEIDPNKSTPATLLEDYKNKKLNKSDPRYQLLTRILKTITDRDAVLRGTERDFDAVMQGFGLEGGVSTGLIMDKLINSLKEDDNYFRNSFQTLYPNLSLKDKGLAESYGKIYNAKFGEGDSISSGIVNVLINGKPTPIHSSNLGLAQKDAEGRGDTFEIVK